MICLLSTLSNSHDLLADLLAGHIAGPLPSLTL
jgi:hypothetical protein